MMLTRGKLANIDRRLLAELAEEEGSQPSRLPISPATWSAWNRYCDVIGIPMGRAIVAMIKMELASVVDEDLVAGLHVTGQPVVRRRADAGVTGDVARGDGELVAHAQVGRTVGEPAQPDLGPLQVGEDADPTPCGVGSLADTAVALLLLGLGAVAHVEAGHIHAGIDELADAFG